MTSISGRRYDTLEPVTIEMNGGRIARISPLSGLAPDVQLPYLAPGLVDLQVNGFGGQNFNSLLLAPEHVEQISRALDEHGVTRFLATVTTDSFQTLDHAVRTIAAAMESSA